MYNKLTFASLFCVSIYQSRFSSMLLHPASCRDWVKLPQCTYKQMALVGNGLNLAYEPLYHIINRDYPELFGCPEVFETDGQFRLLEGQSVGQRNFTIPFGPPGPSPPSSYILLLDRAIEP